MLDNFRKIDVTWDKASRKIYELIKIASSDENGRKLVVQVLDGGLVEDLSGTSLHLYWETANEKNKGLDAFEEVDASKGIFQIYFTTEMASNVGILTAHLHLVDDQGTVTSEPFKISVFKGVDNDAVESSNSFSSLTKILIEARNLEENYAPQLAELKENDESITAQLAHKAERSDLEKETKRINNLIANAGDTDDNAELLDIRVGFDGLTYPTAGEAVRSLGDYLTLQGKQIFKLNNEVFDSGLRLGVEALKTQTTSVYDVSDNRLKVTSSGTHDHIVFEFKERFHEDDLGDIFYASIKYELKNPVDELRIRLIDQQLRITDEPSLSLNQTHTVSVYERYERLDQMLTRPFGYARYGSVESATDSSYYISKPLLLNLTKIFGEGNEPTEEEIKDILSSMPDNWFEGERTFVRNIKNDTTEGEGNGNEDEGQSYTKVSYDDIKVDRVRDVDLDTTYFLTWVNNETFSGGKIVPKVKITADNAESTNIRSVRQFISDEDSEGREYEVVINAGIQMPDNVADGLIISEGEILRDAPQETHLNQYALGINNEGNLKAFPHTVSAQEILSDGYTNAVVAFVPLIENGEKVEQSIIEICPHWSQFNPRQVIGQFDNGDYIIMTVNGRLPNERGMTLPEMADILIGLGVDFAYNLDGGGSTQTFIKKKRVNQNYNRTRPTLITFERID